MTPRTRATRVSSRQRVDARRKLAAFKFAAICR